MARNHVIWLVLAAFGCASQAAPSTTRHPQAPVANVAIATPEDLTEEISGLGVETLSPNPKEVNHESAAPKMATARDDSPDWHPGESLTFDLHPGWTQENPVRERGYSSIDLVSVTSRIQITALATKRTPAQACSDEAQRLAEEEGAVTSVPSIAKDVVTFTWTGQTRKGRVLCRMLAPERPDLPLVVSASWAKRSMGPSVFDSVAKSVRIKTDR